MITIEGKTPETLKRIGVGMPFLADGHLFVIVPVWRKNAEGVVAYNISHPENPWAGVHDVGNRTRLTPEEVFNVTGYRPNEIQLVDITVTYHAQSK